MLIMFLGFCFVLLLMLVMLSIALVLVLRVTINQNASALPARSRWLAILLLDTELRHQYSRKV